MKDGDDVEIKKTIRTQTLNVLNNGKDSNLVSQVNGKPVELQTG